MKRHLSCVQGGLSGASVSSGVDAEGGVGGLAAPVAGADPCADPCPDTWAFQRAFPDLWLRYLTVHYRGRRGAIMEAFGVDDRTVRAWLSGLNAPRGSVVAMAALRHPAFFAEAAAALATDQRRAA